MVEEKSHFLLRRVADFKRMFDDLIKQILPCFWDEKGDFLLETEYIKKLIERRQDHSSIQDLSAPLKGEISLKYWELILIFSISS